MATTLPPISNPDGRPRQHFHDSLWPSPGNDSCLAWSQFGDHPINTHHSTTINAQTDGWLHQVNGDTCAPRGDIDPVEAKVFRAWPVFQPLRGDPRFEAARSKMLQHLNEERAEMGLEPLST